MASTHGAHGTPVGLHVRKRNGDLVPASFDEISTRLVTLSEGLDRAYVDPLELSQKTIQGLYPGIPTEDIDQLSAQYCADRLSLHPDFGVLAVRIIVSNLHKTTPGTFVDAMAALDGDGLLDPAFMAFVREHEETLNGTVEHSRDLLFDFFGIQTLKRSYLMTVADAAANKGTEKVGRRFVERPQYMWLRVAVALHFTPGVPGLADALARIRETYEILSTKGFTHATPTLFNAGTKHPQYASCFLMGTEDSIQGLYQTVSDCAMISKWSGGLGVHLSNVRARGGLIKSTGGTADGLIPYIKVLNATVKHCNQSGKRNGSIALYLEPHHADVMDFLELKLPAGAEDVRARDVFLALWVSDLFMERVRDNGIWSLFCPSQAPGLDKAYGQAYRDLYAQYESERRFVRQVQARDVWQKIIVSQVEAGMPYMCYKDAVNEKSNQKNVGTIHSSNLCVAGDTRILTSKGYRSIKQLAALFNTSVWNGHEFAVVRVVQTGVMQRLCTVKLSNGLELRCTPYHKFLLDDGTRCPAGELTRGAALLKWDLPAQFVVDADAEVNNRQVLPTQLDRALAYGAATGLLGARSACDPWSLTLRGHRQCCPNTVARLRAAARGTTTAEDEGRVVHSTTETEPVEVIIEWEADPLPPRGLVPFVVSVAERREFIRGLMVAATSVRPDGADSREELHLALPEGLHPTFLQDVLLLGQSVGLSTGRILANKHLVMWDAADMVRVLTPDLAPEAPAASVCVTVVDVVDEGHVEDTYCFHEPQRQQGVFGGILTGQCAEITLYSDAADEEAAVCTLGSISLPACLRPVHPADPHGPQVFDFERLGYLTGVMLRNLDRVIDLTFYPVPATQNSNMRLRPVGIGIQGLADVFARLGLPFTDPLARKLNEDIAQVMYYHAARASCDLAKVLGPYEKFAGSPLSQGLFQFDLWGVTPNRLGTGGVAAEVPGLPLAGQDLDWDTLRRDIETHGVRNSTFMALMPTASTAQILGNTESFEPITSNLYTRRTLAGDFIMVNPYLVRDLLQRGLWSAELKQMLVAAQGSLQRLGPEVIPADLLERYQTVWDLPAKDLLEMAAARGPYVCQSQSLNVYLADPTPAALTQVHMLGWKRGLKTGSYYIRAKPAAHTVQFSVDPSLSQRFRAGASTGPVKARGQPAADAGADEGCHACSA